MVFFTIDLLLIGGNHPPPFLFVLSSVIQLKQKLIKNKTSDYLFATKKSGKISQGYVRKLIDELVKELRWSKKVTCHTLRHSFATSLLRKNVSLVHISRLLGHSSLRVTELYVHLVQDELVDAIEKL